jgi:cytochrome c
MRAARRGSPPAAALKRGARETNGVDSGAAQEIGQPRCGFALAQRLCTDCHAIQKEYARSPNVNAPRFRAIASNPGMTAITLSAALNTSHHSMPNITLAVGEQADIIPIF